MVMVSKPKNQVWPPKWLIMGPKIEIFNFELEIKLDHHFYVEFHGESNGDGLEAQKPSLGPKMAIKGPKIEIFNFELEIKLDHHFYVKFRDESNGDSLEV